MMSTEEKRGRLALMVRRWESITEPWVGTPMFSGVSSYAACLNRDVRATATNVELSVLVVSGCRLLYSVQRYTLAFGCGLSRA